MSYLVEPCFLKYLAEEGNDKLFSGMVVYGKEVSNTTTLVIFGQISLKARIPAAFAVDYEEVLTKTILHFRSTSSSTKAES